MVGNKQTEDAVDAVEVEEKFEGPSKKESKQPNETESAMTLEAAKIMVDEGAPGKATTLIQEVSTQKKTSIKKRMKRQ